MEVESTADSSTVMTSAPASATASVPVSVSASTTIASSIAKRKEKARARTAKIQAEADAKHEADRIEESNRIAELNRTAEANRMTHAEADRIAKAGKAAEEKKRLADRHAKPTTVELARESRVVATEKLRQQKRDVKIASHRKAPPLAQEAVAEDVPMDEAGSLKRDRVERDTSTAIAAETTREEYAVNPVFDPTTGQLLHDPSTGESLTGARMEEMIREWASFKGWTYEYTVEFLEVNSSPQDFVTEFYGFLRNPSEAWTEQEQEIVFSEDKQEDAKPPAQESGWAFDDDLSALSTARSQSLSPTANVQERPTEAEADSVASNTRSKRR